ncbi:MAG: hypothetical protein FRX49_04805 [Trebouxia sp. A1-2]|nr:MAG: hypothetical protein FRX49_04805 [Trebouxia sp. A1-2]
MSKLLGNYAHVQALTHVMLTGFEVSNMDTLALLTCCPPLPDKHSRGRMVRAGGISSICPPSTNRLLGQPVALPGMAVWLDSDTILMGLRAMRVASSTAVESALKQEMYALMLQSEGD